MRALVKYATGKGNVGVRDVPVRAPRPEEILIKVKYCGICGTDLHIEADEFPNAPPVVMGHEYCGTVAQVGERARDRWSVGDRVVGELHTGACGECALCLAGKPHICDRKLALGSKSDGALAEYLTLPAWLAHPIPDGVPWEVAGVTEPFAITAHCLVERGGLTAGQSVLISGAATMGLMATIWASRLGAGPIIVSGTNLDAERRFPLAHAMGVDHTVNVQQESLREAGSHGERGAATEGGPYERRNEICTGGRPCPPTPRTLREVVMALTGGAGVDIWIECSGSGAAIAQGLDLVKKTGRAILIGLVGPETIPVPWNTILYKEIDLVGCFSSPPSSWEKALAAEREEADKLRQLVSAIIPLDAWEEGFGMMRRGEAVKILVDMEA